MKQKTIWKPFLVDSLPEKYESIILDYGNGKVKIGVWYDDIYLSNVMVKNQYFDNKCRWISLDKLLKL